MHRLDLNYWIGRRYTVATLTRHVAIAKAFKYTPSARLPMVADITNLVCLIETG